jgi:hypothetical protein
MIIHFEFEVIKRLHYHCIIGFQPLLDHFSIGFNLLNLDIYLFEDIKLLVSIVDYGFECIYFWVVFIQLFQNSVQEVLVLVHFIN